MRYFSLKLKNNRVFFGLCAGICLCVSGFILLRSYSASFGKEYISLCFRLFQLEKEEKSRYVFDIVPIPGELKRLGNTEKYFLRDKETDRMWMFKPHIFGFFSMMAEGISKISRISGLNTPELGTIRLPINGKYYFGSLLEYVRADKFPSDYTGFDGKDRRHLQSLEQAHMIAYLFDFRPDFIIPPDGVPMVVDFDDVRIPIHDLFDLEKSCKDEQCRFCIRNLAGHISNDKQSSSESYAGFLRRYVPAGWQQVSSRQTCKIARFIEDMDERDFLSFFWSGFEDSKTYKEYIQSVLERKKTLTSVLGNKGERFSVWEMLIMIRSVKDRIGKLEQRLKSFSPKKQPMLNVVSCSEAWGILSIYHEGDIDLPYEDIERLLADIRGASKSPYEIEAIDYCLNVLHNLPQARHMPLERFRYKLVTPQMTGEADPQHIRNLTFTLNDKQPFTSGSSEKFLLRDSNGDRWLFKMPFEYYDPEQYFGVPCIQTDAFLSLLYEAWGIPGVGYQPVIVKVNGKRRYGNLSRFLSDVESIEQVGVERLNAAQRQLVHKTFILDWLFAVFGVDPGDFLINKTTGDMVVFDKEHAFRDLAVPSLVLKKPSDFIAIPKFGGFYSRFFKQAAMEHQAVDMDDLFSFIDAIQSLDDRLFLDLLRPYLRKSTTLKFNMFNGLFLKIMHEGQFDYMTLRFGSIRLLTRVDLKKILRLVTEEEVRRYEMKLLARKHAMKEYFVEFYREFVKKDGSPVQGGKTNGPGADFAQKSEALNKGVVKEFLDISGSADIRVVASERAFFLLKHNPPLMLSQDDLIRELRAIHVSESSEKEAIDMYIQKVYKNERPIKRIIRSASGSSYD